MSTTTNPDTRATDEQVGALLHLATTVTAYRDAEEAMGAATRDRDAAIRAAVKSGHAAAEIARLAGVSRARVYQVLAGGVTTEG